MNRPHNNPLNIEKKSQCILLLEHCIKITYNNNDLNGKNINCTFGNNKKLYVR